MYSNSSTCNEETGSKADSPVDENVDEAAVHYAMKMLGMDSDKLRDGQRRAINSVLERRDTFVVLPTGYGKSIIYQTAPFIEDYRLHNKDCQCATESHIEKKGIAIVISPLVALMSNQVKKLQERGISAINLATVKTAEEKNKLREGKYSIVYATPESLLKSGTGLLSTPVYRSNVCGIFIDEGHCVAKWGYKNKNTAAFRKKYSRIAELRSFVKSTTPLVVLTATASSTVKTVIINGTGLVDYNVVELSPEKTNIRYSVVWTKADNLGDRFAWLANELEDKKQELPKVIVFCKVISNCSSIHAALTKNNELEKYVAIFHAVSHIDRKQEILDDFVKENGVIRVLLCTSAFGMGVDVPNLYTVVHYGPSRDVDDYFQESGRVGRDGKQSFAILINFKGRGKGKFNDDIKTYMNEQKKCRRKMLVEHYGHEAITTTMPHNCCDFCSRSCKCGDDELCMQSVGWAERAFIEQESNETVKKTMYSRDVKAGERETVKNLIVKYQQSLVDDGNEGSLYTGTSIASGLPLQVIQQIVDQLHTIHDAADLQERFPLFNPAHAHRIWNIIDEICTAPVLRTEDHSSSSSSESESGESNTSLQDYDSDCEELTELIRNQYARVALPLSEGSEEDI
ncbi:uncharacterized protein [Amphiura filiformis]|uniref:uncharacterized protein n=1 Tax=Amphiura filiformis TaxID=82378 RepID=UPI003B212E70